MRQFLLADVNVGDDGPALETVKRDDFHHEPASIFGRIAGILQNKFLPGSFQHRPEPLQRGFRQRVTGFGAAAADIEVIDAAADLLQWGRIVFAGKLHPTLIDVQNDKKAPGFRQQFSNQDDLAKYIESIDQVPEVGLYSRILLEVGVGREGDHRNVSEQRLAVFGDKICGFITQAKDNLHWGLRIFIAQQISELLQVDSIRIPKSVCKLDVELDKDVETPNAGSNAGFGPMPP